MCIGRPGIFKGVLTYLLAAFSLAARPSGAPRDFSQGAGESFYVVVYGAEAPGNEPETSHCFATFARVVSPDRLGGAPRVELHHVNWFSVRGHETGATHGLFELDGRPTRAERGENRTTRDALALADRGGLRVTRYGPYEIDRRLFERALRQIDLLEGRVPGKRMLYKALDLGYRDTPEAPAVNCIHAVSDIDTEAGRLRTWTTYGSEAARRITAHFRRWLKAPFAERTDVWGPIWKATWQGATAPESLVLLPGEVPADSRATPGREAAGKIRAAMPAFGMIRATHSRSPGGKPAGGGH
jgi:hypothetical protein